MILKITVDFLDYVKLFFIFLFLFWLFFLIFVLILPSTCVPCSFSETSSLKTACPQNLPKKASVILSTSWRWPWPIFTCRNHWQHSCATVVNLLPSCPLHFSPGTTCWCCSKVHSKIWPTSCSKWVGLSLPLFLVKMMDNFSQGEVLEGQPGECWMVTAQMAHIMSFWWTLMSFRVLWGKYITRTLWENIVTGPCNFCL